MAPDIPLLFNPSNLFNLRWMTSWQNSVGQQFERVLQQNSYDHDSHSKGHKQLERLLVEGFDRCQLNTTFDSKPPLHLNWVSI